MSSYVLTLSCPDRPGLVHAVSSFLFNQGADITASQQFDDAVSGQFFMRVALSATDTDDPDQQLHQLREAFTPVAAEYQMTWHFYSSSAPYRTLIMVSRMGHCLNDLLFRRSIGELNIDVPLVVSNHPDLERMCASYDVAFHHLPVSRETKEAAEDELLGLVEDLDIDLVVLARYMQILSPRVCKALEGKAINIHHSFLPSFKGSGAYRQAYERGVKLIGATAHYVTPDLDEGPIIEQDVTRVDHSFTDRQLTDAGRDVESQVLARAVRWHTETRLLLDGPRVVVFR